MMILMLRVWCAKQRAHLTRLHLLGALIVMKFCVLSRGVPIPSSGNNTIYLKIDHWNDYSFVTMFFMSLHDENGNYHEIGNIKIGFKGQTTETPTYKKLPNEFDRVGDGFFSVGQHIDFYRNMASLPNGRNILVALNDIVVLPDIIEDITEENVFSTSLLRDGNLSILKGQYARVFNGQPALTDFKFKFVREETDSLGGIDLSFNVKVNSTPNTNIHAIIGRNGVGKTTLLNGMIDAVTARQTAAANFFDDNPWYKEKISSDYFASLVSVSFSAFDPFIPPQEQPNPAKGTCYFYIGLKDRKNENLHRTIDDLQEDCITALTNCFYHKGKTERWLTAIDKLGSDENFASMKLERLEAVYRELRNTPVDDEQPDSKNFQRKYKEKVAPFLSRMSSGHAIVLLTITRLVATVEEKTLVLLDEPESHLHPPLLSAFVRALADLLHDRNGVAIIATHSPVVLQEIPRSCVWKIYRVGTNITSSRPDIETFAENVGVLTSEVFSLEVERSGFHDLLAKSVKTGKTYKEIVDDYDNQLGFEGRAILAALIANRDRSISHDATE
jgi:predicted ATPase